MATPKKERNMANLQKLFHQIEGMFFSHLNRRLQRGALIESFAVSSLCPQNY